MTNALNGSVIVLPLRSGGDKKSPDNETALGRLISAGIFAFTLCWNEFIYALTFISTSSNKTVPVAVLSELVDGDVYHWGSLMAGALLGTLLVAILYSFFVDY